MPHFLQRHVVDPEVTWSHQSEGWTGLLLLLDVADVGEPGPAERPLLVERDVVPIEHELGAHAVGAGADVEPAQVRGDPIPARFEREVLNDPDLGRGPAEQQARVLSRVSHSPDPELAVAFVDPAAPLGEDQAETVLVFGDFEGGVFKEVAGFATDGEGRESRECHREQRRTDRHTHRLISRTYRSAPRPCRALGCWIILSELTVENTDTHRGLRTGFVVRQGFLRVQPSTILHRTWAHL